MHKPQLLPHTDPYPLQHFYVDHLVNQSEFILFLAHKGDIKTAPINEQGAPKGPLIIYF